MNILMMSSNKYMFHSSEKFQSLRVGSYDTHKITNTNTDRLLTGIFNTDRSITDALFIDTLILIHLILLLTEIVITNTSDRGYLIIIFGIYKFLQQL